MSFQQTTIVQQYLALAQGLIDLNQVNPETGNTIMHFAGKAYGYWPQLYTMLAELGGNTNLKNFAGQTADELMQACLSEHVPKESYDFVSSDYYS